MLQSPTPRSAGLSSAGTRGRPELPEPAAARLATMASRLPGVHGSRPADGGCGGGGVRGGWPGVVVVLVDATRVGNVIETLKNRGGDATGVEWRVFSAPAGGASGFFSTRACRELGKQGEEEGSSEETVDVEGEGIGEVILEERGDGELSEQETSL
ncbi:unnamed protein product [Choristocarpus tenellus]